WSPPDGRILISAAGGTVEVSDDGPGIPADDLPYIFDRFYRSAQARALPGSGLGLAIVRRIADIHHGTVEAIPLQQGVKFRISVPTSLRACSRAGWLSVDAAIRRRAAAGDSTVCPSAATRTSPIRSAGGVDLTRNPAAPARSARSTYWSASKVVSTTTTGGSASLPIRSIAVRPSTPGMRRSMSTRSGRLRTTASTPAAPS